jgi:hypothetical protein
MIRFLRLHNAGGGDVYIRPYADQHNAGYILVDLDPAAPGTLERMRAQGHQPCVLVQTSAGHLQAWVRVSETPLQPALATAIAQHLAHVYHGDPASADWCHLGRLAGFTNQRPARRRPSGYAPWVRLLYARTQLATNAVALLEAAQRRPSPSPRPSLSQPVAPTLTPPGATAIYHRFLDHLRIPQRFPQPDWSIADLWIAKELLRCHTSAAQIQAILRLASPGFPRRHTYPEDYLARTLRRAELELQHAGFLARPRAPRVQAGPHP